MFGCTTLRWIVALSIGLKLSCAPHPLQLCLKCAGKTWLEVQCEMTECLDKIGKWMYNNYLTLNIDTTIFMTFGCYRDSIPSNFELSIYNEKIKRVNSCKYIGVNFDCHMRWNMHLKDLIKKLDFAQYILQTKKGNKIKVI
jgi:hypothetical protein